MNECQSHFVFTVRAALQMQSLKAKFCLTQTNSLQNNDSYAEPVETFKKSYYDIGR